MRHLTVTMVVLAEAFLLTLPGYCSDWWPVWGQIISLALGVLGLAVVVSILEWELRDKEN